MLTFSSAHRYFLYRPAVDLRKSFNGLAGLVTNQMGRDAASGDAFIFLNRRRDSVKMLVWDRTGFIIFYKRLERGTFELPAATDGGAQPLPWSALLLILEGVSLASARYRKRFERG
jgi:transposase